MYHTDVIIIGAGLAGLTVAWQMRYRSVTVIRPAPEDGSSYLARGGIAAAVGKNDDPAHHAEDTLVAADGIADPRTVDILTDEGIQRLEQLCELPVDFDRNADGDLLLGREALHSRNRIVHVSGDETGRHVTSAVHGQIKHRPDITFVDGRVLGLITENQRVYGVVFTASDGRVETMAAPATVLATGGMGALYSRTTNPPSARGAGVAMAARAGATLADLEFVQFHPTALKTSSRRLPLLSEAIRGQGATLVDEDAHPVMADHPHADLAGRDVIARRLARLIDDGTDVFLDATDIDDFPTRFPSAWTACNELNLDPRHDPIPVTPAAHYHMGGVATDTFGSTSIDGLWAVGEVASTGVHGANRLASNSLLEALVFATRAARDIATVARRPHRVPVERLTELRQAWQRGLAGIRATESPVEALAEVMWHHVGIERSRSGLQHALDFIEDQLAVLHRFDPRRLPVETALHVTRAALERRESRGAHFRRDFPDSNPDCASRTFIDKPLPTSPENIPTPERLDS